MKLIIFHLRKRTESDLESIAKELEEGFNFKFKGIDPIYKKEGMKVLSGEAFGIIVYLKKSELSDGSKTYYGFSGDPVFDVIDKVESFYDISEYLKAYLDFKKITGWEALPSDPK